MKKRVLDLVGGVLAVVVMLMSAIPVAYFDNGSLENTGMITANAAISSAEVVNRANYLYNLTWTPKKTIYGYGQNYTFTAGKVYHIPYGMIVSGGKWVGSSSWTNAITPEKFIEYTKDSSSKLYTSHGGWESSGYKNAWYCPYYAMDCSAFVSYCWNINRHTTNNLPGTNLGIVSKSTIDNIQIGDAINNIKSHVKLVTSVARDGNGKVTSIEIMEETPPELRKVSYSRSEFISNNSSYYIYRYASVAKDPPSNVKLTINKSNFFSGDTITLTPSASNATDYYLAIRNVDGTIVHDKDNITGKYSIKADTFVCGEYTVWVSAKNAAGGTDSNHITFSINVGSNLGNDFKALIINSNSKSKPWKPILQNDSGNVVLGSETKNNYDSTLWHFIRNSDDGTYTIWSYKNGAVLDVEDGANKDGTGVCCWESHGASNQRWYIIQRSDGTYRLKPKCATRVLDVAGGATKDGTKIDIKNSDDSTGQCFIIYTLDKDRDKVNYTISADKTSINRGGKVNITVSGAIPYVYQYKFHVIDPNGKETVVDNKCDPVYSLTGSAAGKYTIYAEIKSPLYTDKGSKTEKCVTVTVKDYTVNIHYNTNGGTIAKDSEYYAESNGDIYKADTKELLAPSWANGYKGKNGLYNASTFKLSKTGYTFLGWSLEKTGGTVFDQHDNTISANDLFPDVTKKSGTITLYAQWKINTVTLKFNTNGGIIADGSKYYADENGNIYITSSNKIVAPAWEYGYKDENGLYNASTLKLSRSGYTFLGWSLSKTDGTIYDQDDSTVSASDLFPDIKTKSGEILLYARWEKNEVIGDCDADGELTVADTVLLQKWLLSVPDTKLSDWKAADLCEDGVIDIFDLAMMKRALLNK